MSVLVIAPHPDDEAIGCGGSVAKHSANAERVEVVFLTSGELALSRMPREEAWRLREREAEAAAAVLGIAELSFLRMPDWYLGDHADAGPELTKVIERKSPQIVYLPHPRDWHPDHRAAAELAIEAGRRVGLGSGSLLGYEVWTPLEAYDVVEDVGAVFPSKLEAIHCYESQCDHFDYVRAATGIGEYRGAMAGRCDYAEVFAQW